MATRSASILKDEGQASIEIEGKDSRRQPKTRSLRMAGRKSTSSSTETDEKTDQATTSRRASLPMPTMPTRSANLIKDKDGSYIYKRRSLDPTSSHKVEGGMKSPVSVNTRKRPLEPSGLAASPGTKRRRTLKKGHGLQDAESDFYCWLCHNDAGPSTCCALCPRLYHLKCLNADSPPEDDWVCPECSSILKAEGADTKSRAMSLLSLEQLCTLLKFAAQRMKQSDSDPFHYPVEASEHPNYANHIINAMDISTLERNIRKKHYGSTEAFLADVKWIVHNSMVYNGAQSKLTATAKTVVKICKHEMNEIEICPDCYLNSCIQRTDDWFCEPCRDPHPLVWAKMKGYPFWPAKALREAKGQVDVRFFGQHDRAWVPITQVFLLSKEPPVAVKKGKQGFDEAQKEVEIHINKIKKKFDSFEYSPFHTPFLGKNPYHQGRTKHKIHANEPPARVDLLLKVTKAKDGGRQTVEGEGTQSGSSPTKKGAHAKKPEKLSSVTRKTASAVKLKYNSIITTRKSALRKAQQSYKPAAVVSSKRLVVRLSSDECKSIDEITVDNGSENKEKTKTGSPITTESENKGEKTVSPPPGKDSGFSDQFKKFLTVEKNKKGADEGNNYSDSDDAAAVEESENNQMDVEEKEDDSQELTSSDSNKDAQQNNDSANSDKLGDLKTTTEQEKSATAVEKEGLPSSDKQATGTTESDDHKSHKSKAGIFLANVNVSEPAKLDISSTLSLQAKVPSTNKEIVEKLQTTLLKIQQESDNSEPQGENTAGKGDSVSDQVTCEPEKDAENSQKICPQKEGNTTPERKPAGTPETAGSHQPNGSNHPGKSGSPATELSSNLDMPADNGSSSPQADEPAATSTPKARQSLDKLVKSFKEKLGNSSVPPPAKDDDDQSTTSSASNTGSSSSSSDSEGSGQSTDDSDSGDQNKKKNVSPTEESSREEAVQCDEEQTAAKRRNQSATSSEQEKMDFADSSTEVPATTKNNAAEPVTPPPHTSAKSVSAVIAYPDQLKVPTPPVESQKQTGNKNKHDAKTTDTGTKTLESLLLHESPAKQQSDSACQANTEPHVTSPNPESWSQLQALHDMDVTLTQEEMTRYSSQLMQTLQGTMQETVHGLCQQIMDAKAGKAIRKCLELSLEKAKWEQKQELKEMEHCSELTMLEMRAILEQEKQRAISDSKKCADQEKKKAIEETKKKQWCANCGKEAIFYCCWNTSYCDYPCQQAHWSRHMELCTHSQTGVGGNEASSGKTGGGGSNRSSPVTTAVTPNTTTTMATTTTNQYPMSGVPMRPVPTGAMPAGPPVMFSVMRNSQQAFPVIPRAHMAYQVAPQPGHPPHMYQPKQ